MATTNNPIVDGDSAQRFIDDVRAEHYAAYSTTLGQGALKDLQQTFPHAWLYVGELLQNAVDAGATSIRLAVDEGSNALVFEHNGGAFEAKQVKALCARGVSTKGAATVGFMGIGFKAVFQSFEAVDVTSGPWRFRLCVREEVGDFGDRQRDWLGCVLPSWVDNLDDPSPGMRCRFVLHNRLKGLSPIHTDIERVLSTDRLVLALLAQRGIETFEWNGQRWQLSQTTHAVDEQTTRLTLEALDERADEVRQWVLFSATYQPSREAIARFLEHRQIKPRPEEKEVVYKEAQRVRRVDSFCPLDEKGVPVPPRRGQAYALLATGVSVPIGLHIQADWLLNTSRQELMDVESNAWHQEILGRLARLLRAYLEWTATLPALADDQIAKVYAVLPSWTTDDGEFSTYLSNQSFRDDLRSALSDLAFLPVRRQNGTQFATPTETKLIPPLLRGFDDTRSLPWVLFGDDVISTGLLGDQTLRSLEELQFLRPLRVEDIAGRWESGAVGTWRTALADKGPESHLRLIRALASLDEVKAWREARLKCLPSVSGEWISRDTAIRMPPDWDSIPEKNPPLRTWLEPFLAGTTARVDWNFDRALQRDTNARAYVAEIPQEKLDEVLENWWKAQPITPDESTCKQVLDVTVWVLTKLRQRPGLVKRVLCNGAEHPLLVGLNDAVLADPYASSARRQFFPKQHPVSGRYVNHLAGLSEADWRSFFESANTTLRGPFQLREVVQELSAAELRKALPGYSPPDTRSTWMTTNWKGRVFASNRYLLTDAELPAVLQQVVAGVVSIADARAMSAWLNEARQVLLVYPKRQVVYVPFGTSFVAPSTINVPATWVRSLGTSCWLYGTDGTGPHRPDQVLAHHDPARPDAPVADLPSELVATLETCGVRFGTAVPDVVSIERLRREGPSADNDRLLTLLDQAVVDVGNDKERRVELIAVLRSTKLLPVPVGMSLVDGSVRVTAERLVQRAARGVDLGGWLVSVDAATKDLRDQDAYVRLLQIVGSLYDVPDAPTWEQALSFLEWVWAAGPDAESVRRTLPRVYRIIVDELASDPARQALWAQSRVRAMVYGANRRWTSVTSDNLFLDDLGDDRLKNILSGLVLATPSHLGDAQEDQLRVGVLLGVKCLSSRFDVKLLVDAPRALPAQWAKELSAINTLIQSYALDDEERDAVVPDLPGMTYGDRIQKSLVDAGTQTHNWEVFAARDGGRIVLAGAPDDFAAELCSALLQWAGVAGRRDLGELVSKVTQLIGWLDRPDKFAKRLEEFLTQQGIKATPQPAGETPAGPSTPTNGPTTPASPTVTTPARGSSGDTPVTDGSADATETDDEKETPGAEGGEGPQPPSTGGPSGKYTPDVRESRLHAKRKQLAALTAELNELLGVGPLPEDKPTPDGDDENDRSKPFATDVPFRDAVVEYEGKAGRYAEAKDAGQPGFDIESYDRPLDDPNKKLARRIEVKGRGRTWEDDETVELSDRQFLDAINKNTDGQASTEDFDYWLYVVEREHDASLHVLPIKNPSRRAAKFEFRGGTWRDLAEAVPNESEDEPTDGSEQH